jgi:hypothetical protein
MKANEIQEDHSRSGIRPPVKMVRLMFVAESMQEKL